MLSLASSFSLTYLTGSSGVALRTFLTFAIVTYALTRPAERAFYCLLAILPFQNVLKITHEIPIVPSILMVLIILKLLLRRPRLSHYLILIMISLFSIAFVNFEGTPITTLLGWFSIFLLIALLLGRYDSGYIPIDLNSTVLALSMGFAVSSVVSLLFPGIVLNAGIFKESLYYVIDRQLTRFQGFFGDPNYYSQGMLFSSSILLYSVAYSRSLFARVSKILAALFMLLIGYSSLSKMFLLFSIVPLVQLIAIIVNRRKELIRLILNISGFLLFALIIVGIAYFYVFTFPVLRDAFVQRLDIGLTTGRFDSQFIYLSKALSDPVLTLFGVGIGYQMLDKINATAPHNSYIEFYFSIGIVGIVLLLLFYIEVLVVARRRRIYKSRLDINLIFPISCLLLTALSLDAVKLDLFYFYWFIVTYVAVKEERT